MLRTNLATRPFYNHRAVRIGLGAVALVAAALSSFNVAQVLSLNARNAAFVTRAEKAEARATELREQANATRASLDKEDIHLVEAAAREANLLIERRAFSWTDLFNRFEETLPADVRIMAVQPQVDNEARMLVAITVIARRIEDLDVFIEQLEQTGNFRNVLSRQEELQEDGTLRSVIQGYYGPQSGGPAAVSAPAAPDSGEGKAENTSAGAPSASEGPR